MMALPEPHQTRYWHAVLKLEKERKMDLITPLEQSFMDKGWQKGLEKGREEGCRAGAAELLARQLAQRFGQLPKTVEKKLSKATMEQLETWSDAMLTAQSLKQVFE
jgi:predicted transposase YdaD